MVTLQATAEKGTAGAAVTTADGWDTVTLGSGSTAVFDANRAAHGGRSYRLGFVSAAATLGWGSASVGGPYTALWGRIYVNRDALAGTVGLLAVQAGGVTRFRIDLTAAGLLQVVLGGGGTTTGAATLAVTTWYRIQWAYTAGTSGQVVVTVHALDASSVLDTVTGNGDTGTNADTVLVGNLVGAPGSATNLYLDDVAVSSLGPVPPFPTGFDQAAGTDRSSTRYVGKGQQAISTDAGSVFNVLPPVPVSAGDTASANDEDTTVFNPANEVATASEFDVVNPAALVPLTNATWGIPMTLVANQQDKVNGDDAAADERSSMRYWGEGELAHHSESAVVVDLTVRIPKAGADTAGTTTGSSTAYVGEGELAHAGQATSTRYVGQAEGGLASETAGHVP